MSEHYSSRDRRRDSRSRSPRRGRDSRPQRSRSRERQRGGRSRSRSRERDRPRSGGYGDRGGDRSRLIRDGGSRGERHPQVGPHSGRDRAGERHESERRTVAVEAVASAIRGHMQPGSAEAAALLQPESGEIVDDVVIDAAAMEDIDRFLEGEDEEAEAARIAEERRRRREEILQRHQSESVAQAPPAAPAPASTAADQGSMHVSDSNTDFSAYTSDMKLYGTVSAGVGRPAAAAMEADQSEAEVLQAEQQAVQEEAMKNEPQGFDIFSASPSDQEMAVAGLPKRASSGVLKASVLGDEGGSHLQSNYDDTEGYYKLTIGEVIAGRYRTQGVVGKGVFSTVLKCVDLGTEETVAIKMIRNNDVMRKAAEKELSILTMLSDRDPENKKHCVRLLGHTEYRHHTTFVFESLQMNLRDALKKFGKNVGINVGAIRMYGRQLFVALKFLSDLQIVHADIKLDNILVSDDLKQVKICDFGSAFLESDPDRDPTPYLVSRFYRAPEIILGLQYDRMVDMFSVGTCLYELFTGHVMLPGRTNNDMLRLMQAFKGRLPNKILKSHVRSYEKLGLDPHFDTDFKFKHWDQDPVTGKPVLRLMDILQPTKDLSAILLSSKAGADDRNRVLLLADLIHKTIALDPSKRIDPVEAFKHPFFTAKDKAP